MHVSEVPPAAYGTSRRRGANVSHAEIERAALELLAAGTRPAVGSVRQKIGRGSAATIAASLRRFWRDLGARAEGDPIALSRLPHDIAELADGLWQRALQLAAQAAQHEDNAARERLAQLQIENEVRAQSFVLREKEYESAARERERALADSRNHLLATLKMLQSDRATLRARETRIAAHEAQLEDYRRQLALLMTRAVAKHQALLERSPRERASAKPKGAPKRRAPAQRAHARHPSRRRSKR